jgi:hypothetical protein
VSKSSVFVDIPNTILATYLLNELAEDHVSMDY